MLLVIHILETIDCAFALTPNGDSECGEKVYQDWDCETGSVDFPGTLNPDPPLKIICVGGSASASITGTTFHDGSKTHPFTEDCEEGEDGPFPIVYTAESWFVPVIPETFPECGTKTFEGKVKGVTTDEECPSPTGPITVGIFTVKVVGVDSLVPDLANGQGGLEAGSDPPTYWVCPCRGDVIVTATPCPILTEDQLPDCWTFTGGVTIDKLHHKVSKEALKSGDVTFTVTSGTSTKTIVLKTDPEKLGYTAYAPKHDCLFDNFADPSPLIDKCGNMLAIDCTGANPNYPYHTGHYEYKHNGLLVGTCYYNGGENVFLYKTTKHNCLILRTWHLTQQPTSPTKWAVTKYDCTGTGPSINCRTAPAWVNAWGRPADELLNNPGYPANSCENTGTATTPCPPW